MRRLYFVYSISEKTRKYIYSWVFPLYIQTLSIINGNSRAFSYLTRARARLVSLSAYEKSDSLIRVQYTGTFCSDCRALRGNAMGIDVPEEPYSDWEVVRVISFFFFFVLMRVWYAFVRGIVRVSKGISFLWNRSGFVGMNVFHVTGMLIIIVRRMWWIKRVFACYRDEKSCFMAEFKHYYKL